VQPFLFHKETKRRELDSLTAYNTKDTLLVVGTNGNEVSIGLKIVVGGKTQLLSDTVRIHIRL
jgi:hypothetical protein